MIRANKLKNSGKTYYDDRVKSDSIEWIVDKCSLHLN